MEGEFFPVLQNTASIIILAMCVRISYFVLIACNSVLWSSDVLTQHRDKIYLFLKAIVYVSAFNFLKSGKLNLRSKLFIPWKRQNSLIDEKPKPQRSIYR